MNIFESFKKLVEFTHSITFAILFVTLMTSSLMVACRLNPESFVSNDNELNELLESTLRAKGYMTYIAELPPNLKTLFETYVNLVNDPSRVHTANEKAFLAKYTPLMKNILANAKLAEEVYVKKYRYSHEL